ncbi:MAG: hypothetical protein JXR83_20085, partial [Deltaproteobacteria bacterium]|nr:hypothetical protein [Deltaproteobacteria bacterium]
MSRSDGPAPMAAAAVAALALLAGCSGRNVLYARARLPPGFEVRLEGVVYQRADSAGLVAEGRTAYALLAPTTGEAHFDTIELVHRADRFAGGAVEMVAGGGTANLITGKLTLTNGLRVQDGLGRVLDAPALSYSPESRALAGPGPATLTGANYVLRAETGFVVDLESGTVD